MVEKYTLDNFTGQEIKEMINAQEITIDELNTSALQKLMDYEIDLLAVDEGDVELVCKCSDLLSELDPCPITTEHIMNIVRRNEEEYLTIVDDTSYDDVPKRRFIFKRIAVVAAAILLIMTTAVGVASAFGVNIIEEINKIIRQEDGARTDIDGFTFYNGVEAKYYSSIEEIIEEKNWDIMYPTMFPENIKIDKIRLDKGSRDNDTIRIFTNSESIRILIEKNAPKENIWEEHDSFYEVNGLKYHIFQENDVYFASCFYKANYYSIQANNYDDLILIIDNLKE